MGEIKSTLDLVMEKTKHLSQSAAEKRTQAQKETENRLRGLLQKYQDELISFKQLTSDYEGLQAEYKLQDNSALAGQVFDRLDPDGDNRALFKVLERCCNLDAGVLADLMKHYQADVQTAAQSRMQALKASLNQRYNISGSAVVPNLAADEKFQKKVQELASVLDQELKKERIRLVGS